MKGKHAQKKLAAMAPTPLSLKTRGWGWGGAGGCVAYKDRARPPPRETGLECHTTIRPDALMLRPPPQDGMGYMVILFLYTWDTHRLLGVCSHSRMLGGPDMGGGMEPV